MTKTFRLLSISIMPLLALQFILGMISNLYAEFPDTSDHAQLWKFANSNAWVASHMTIGTIIIVIGLIVMVMAIRTKYKSMIAIWGLIFTIMSGAAGERFVSTQQEYWSLIMAIGFLAAAIVYGRLLAKDGRASSLNTPTQQ